MVCILLNNDDLPGLRLFRALQQTGRTDVKLISAEELVYAPSFNCGYQHGKAFFDITLASGFVFSNNTVSTVLNRIRHIPLKHTERFKPEDRSYVQAECIATFTFLFSILPNQLFNATTGNGIGGKNRSNLAWLLLAKKAGFDVPEILYQNNVFQQDAVPKIGVQSQLYFQGNCYAQSGLPSAYCKTLGQLSGEQILEIYYCETETNPLFIRAEVIPSFTNLPTDFLTQLQKQL